MNPEKNTLAEQNSGLQKLFLGILFFGLLLVSVNIALLLNQFSRMNQAAETQAATSTAEITDMPASAEAVIEQATPTLTLEPTASVLLPGMETLRTLEDTLIPENDPLQLADHFKGVTDARVQLMEEPAIPVNGAQKKFWILEVDENFYREITAELIYQTPHLYFWVEQGLAYDREDVIQLCETFENHIYPTDRLYFGSEWTPGVDNDEHLVIVYAQALGSAAGYFSGSDSLMPEVRAYSNTAEMFYLSADYSNLEDPYTYGVLAHEFQHMIHWNHDRNETSWLNEGFSELAVYLNGYDIGGFDYYFAFDPDLQLNFWPGDDQGDSAPHYGASYLFTRYLLSQFGAQTIHEIIQNPKDGLASLDDTLAQKMGSYDPGWLESIRPGDQVFQNWTIANLLQNDQLQDGLYGYGEKQDLPTFSSGEVISCDGDWLQRSVNQYGTDYIQVKCAGDFLVELEGGAATALLPVDAHSGDYYLWSNNGDESHITLSREFDLTQVSAPVTLDYWTWYDIERDYDYLYLTASVDGKKWQILQTTSCTSEDPTGANYGCGYNGQSGDWIKESVDLSSYVGQKVTLQFEYITDASVNGEGFLLDDISIDAINYRSNFEIDSGGWGAQGFVRITNSIPQAFSAVVIRQDFNPSVQKWINPAGMNLDIEIENQNGNSGAILAISGLTRYTRIPAVYRLKITRLN